MMVVTATEREQEQSLHVSCGTCELPPEETNLNALLFGNKMCTDTWTQHPNNF